jgi:hypothetical protein
VASFTAVYDACVLYPAPLRDLLLELGTTGLFRARWTDRIHDEWMRSLLAARPELAAPLARTRELMNQAVPDCLVTDFERLEVALELPDMDDRHVLAAAICARADVIVTYNLKDFPEAALAPYRIEAQHPDQFVRHLFDLNPGAVCAAVKAQRRRLKNPPMTALETLEILMKSGLSTSVAALQDMIDLI